MRIKTLIVEDDSEDLVYLEEMLEHYGKDTDSTFVISFCRNMKDFLLQKENNFDLAFFDIDLTDSNGIDLAKELRNQDKNVLIVFMTNLAQFAINGYEVDAVDYVVKPVSYYDFYLKMGKVMKRIASRGDQLIKIKNNTGFTSIRCSEISYVEINHHTLFYHTNVGIINSYGTLKDFEKKINSNVFVRCNNCYLINLNYVKTIHGNFVMVGNDELLISRPRKKIFVKAVNQFYNGSI